MKVISSFKKKISEKKKFSLLSHHETEYYFENADCESYKHSLNVF